MEFRALDVFEPVRQIDPVVRTAEVDRYPSRPEDAFDRSPVQWWGRTHPARSKQGAIGFSSKTI
jgi:hypothetical protein